MLHSMLAHFFNNRVSHLSTSNNSSGEQISGQMYPSPSTICLTIRRVKGLFRCSEIPGDDHLDTVDRRHSYVKSVFWIIGGGIALPAMIFSARDLASSSISSMGNGSIAAVRILPPFASWLGLDRLSGPLRIRLLRYTFHAWEQAKAKGPE